LPRGDREQHPETDNENAHADQDPGEEVGERAAHGSRAHHGTSTIATPHGSVPALTRAATALVAVSITATSPARPTVT